MNPHAIRGYLRRRLTWRAFVCPSLFGMSCAVAHVQFAVPAYWLAVVAFVLGRIDADVDP